MTPEIALSAPRVIAAEGLGDLYRVLVAEGYRVIGPTVQDGAIVLRELSSAAELPFGWGVRLEPGGYRLRRRDDQAAFGHSAGPQTWNGRGLCAEALPELITLDDWGFPIVSDQAVPLRLLADARETTRLCPKLALWLERG